MGDLFGRMVAGEYQPGQYMALWINYFEGDHDDRAESQYIDAEEWVRHNYAQIYIGGHAGEYIILGRTSETATQWTTAQGNTPNSDVRIWGIRGNIAIPNNYNLPSLRNLTLDPDGSVTRFAGGTNTIQVLENSAFEVYVALADGNRLAIATPNPPVTSGFANVKAYSSGIVKVRMGTTDATLRLEQEAIPRDFVRLQPDDPSSGAIATGGNDIEIDLVLPSDGYWRGTVAPSAWDNDINGNLGVTVEVLGTDGTTVIDTGFSNVNGNHNSGAWEYLPPVFLDLGIQVAGTYKIKVSDIA
jgi:hypothetical protein